MFLSVGQAGQGRAGAVPELQRGRPRVGTKDNWAAPWIFLSFCLDCIDFINLL